jgi:hypothetical protein
MKNSFDRRIARSQELAIQFPPSANVLDFYRRLASLQKSVFESVAARGDTDVRTVLRHLPALIHLVETHGPPRLAEYAGADPAANIVAFWDGGAKTAGVESEPLFLARALLHPYAEWLATRGTRSCRLKKPSAPSAAAST